MEMENFIGKVCPFCKTEIKEGDAVKVCSACGIPHHEVCWEENKGCTTFGCSEQHYETQGTNPIDVCSNCKTALGEGQEFCPKCGTPKGGIKKNICSKCGNEIQEGQEFCPKCGQKVGLVMDQGISNAITQFNTDVKLKNEKAKKKPIFIATIAAAVVVLVVLAAVVGPKLMVTTEKLMAEGKHIEAYERASKEEKTKIESINAVAVCSQLCCEALKDSESFDLREAWYNYDGHGPVVLRVAANNSYGNAVVNYCLYTWDSDEEEYSLFSSVSSLEEEESYSWDDDDKKIEKALNNITRLAINNMKENSDYKLSKDDVKNINTLFENDLLDTIELIDIDRSSK